MHINWSIQSCLHILLEERCLSFPATLHAEILCTSDYFKFKVLKQNTFTKNDIIKIGYVSWISMAPVVWNINSYAAGHEKYFMHPFLYIGTYQKAAVRWQICSQHLLSSLLFLCVCFLLAHQLVIFDNLAFYAVLCFSWSSKHSSYIYSQQRA